MFEIVLVAVIVDPTAPVYSLQARRPPTRMPRGLPPVQRLQCRDSGFVQSSKSNLQENRAPTAKNRQIRLLERTNHPAHSMAFKFFTDDYLARHPDWTNAN